MALEAGIQIGDIVITLNGEKATVESMINPPINKMLSKTLLNLKYLEKVPLVIKPLS